MKKLLLYIALNFFIFNNSHSGEGLKGIYYFDLVVEDIKNKSCNVTSKDVEREIKFVLSNSPIKLKKDINIEAISVSPNIVESNNICAGSIEIEILQGGINTSSIGTKYVGYQVSYDIGYLFITNISRFKDGYLNSVNMLTKEFVNKWREFN